MAETIAASPQDPNRRRFSCVFHIANGIRCQKRGPPDSFLCEHHLLHFHRKKPQELFREAAEALADCTSFAKNGLPFLACKDINRWGDLVNAARGLEEFHGYNHLDETFPLLTSTLLSIDKFHRALFAKAPKKWKAFEILVARLYLQELAPFVGAPVEGKQQVGVEVRWNAFIHGKTTKRRRQVDVAITTRVGSLKTFYAVECKDEKIQLLKVEGFKTKLGDIGADKGIMVSSVGFASGAEAAAKAYGIETFVVHELSRTETVRREVTRWVPEVIGLTFELPNATGQEFLQSSPVAIRLVSGIEAPIRTIVDRAIEQGDVLRSLPHLELKLELPGSTLLLADRTERPLADIVVTTKMRKSEANVSLDLPQHPVTFEKRDEMSGKSRIYESGDLPLLDSRLVEPGKYYTNALCQCYYCEKVEGDMATFFLLNDGQYGHKLSLVFLADLDQSIYFYPLQDRKKSRELRSVVEWIQSQESQKPRA